ncbi:hypothetical protein [Bacillus timonensis]|uniref:hypothetical protein n=1 Tax=Bacillus timonensis TaxID=1033734 RepID=UPI000287D750|nr:hypothetical protein [Bacillus timonensis]
MNLLPLPNEVSTNEWFVIISLIVSYSVFFFLPRRKFPMSIIILILLFSATISRIADHLFAGPPLDLYDLMDNGNFEMFDILTYLLYGPFALFFIYLYEKFKIKQIYTFLYIMAFSIFSVVYEWITVLFGVFTFKEWRSIYSFPVYLFVQSLIILYYHLLKLFIKCK